MGSMWTADDEQYLVQHYPTTDVSVLAAHLGRSIRGVKHRVNDLRLRKARGFETRNIFADWSTEMAYILGFTITDGCVSQGRLSYGVAAKDACVLEHIASVIAPGKAVSFYEEQRLGIPHITCRLKLCDPAIVASLASFRVVPRKTGNEYLPDCPHKFKPDLLRGIFDGDGGVHITNRRTGQLVWQVTSASESFLVSVRRELGFGFGSIRPDKSFYRWHVYRQDNIRTLADFMYYPDHPFSLKRKRDRFYARPTYI